MALGEHLRELRNRLIKSTIALILGAIVGLALYSPIFSQLIDPIMNIAEDDDRFATINFDGVASSFDLMVQTSLFMGVIVSCPVWLYQMWAFITPGLLILKKPPTQPHHKWISKTISRKVEINQGKSLRQVLRNRRTQTQQQDVAGEGQRRSKMDNQLYKYSPIVDRPALEWPEGKRIAFYLGLNLEHYQVDKPSTSIFGGTAGLQPDPLNFGWRDYGLRVGIWRMMESLDRYGIRASALVNSDVCKHYPQVIEAGRERDWAWVAHGRDNSTFEAGMSREEEMKYLQDVVTTIKFETGTQPRGWLGPALTETHETPSILAGLGVNYLLDWCADDQPFHLNEDGMISVPYSIEVNDVTLFSNRNMSGPEFLQLVIDQYEQLSKDSAAGGRVMALALHPFIIGQPFRHKYLDLALEFIANQSDVWLTTSDEIAAHYLKEFPAS